MSTGSHTCYNCGNWVFDNEYSCPYCGAIQSVAPPTQYSQQTGYNTCQNNVDPYNDVTTDQHISASTNGQIVKKKRNKGCITCSVILIGAIVFIILSGTFIKKAYSEIMLLNSEAPITSDLLEDEDVIDYEP